VLLYKTLIYSVRGCDETTAIVMALDMMFAGIDTSSHTSSYAMFQLAKHPEVQEKLYREIKKELPDKVKYECTILIYCLISKQCFFFYKRNTV
jgi:cytochrome P450